MNAPFYQPLFDHMSREHGLTLLESEMDEIVRICKELDLPTPFPVSERLICEWDPLTDDPDLK